MHPRLHGRVRLWGIPGNAKGADRPGNVRGHDCPLGGLDEDSSGRNPQDKSRSNHRRRPHGVSGKISRGFHEQRHARCHSERAVFASEESPPLPIHGEQNNSSVHSFFAADVGFILSVAERHPPLRITNTEERLTQKERGPFGPLSFVLLVRRRPPLEPHVERELELARAGVQCWVANARTEGSEQRIEQVLTQLPALHICKVEDTAIASHQRPVRPRTVCASEEVRSRLVCWAWCPGG